MSEKLTFSKSIDVPKKQYDVVVVGGGTSGCVSAISALREKLSVLIVDSQSGLGGSQTSGLVTPTMDMFMPDDSKKKSSIDRMINEKLQKIDGCNPRYNAAFNPIHTQLVLEKMINDNGGDVLLNVSIADVIKNDSSIDYVLLATKNGLIAVKGKYYIDCTGDADLCRLCGVKTYSGNDDGLNQNISLRFEMGGVDIPKYEEFKKKVDSSDGGWHKFMQEKYEQGYIRQDDVYHFQTFRIWGKPNCLSFNCPELGRDRNVADSEYISKKLIEGKQAIYKLATFCRKFIEGFENAYILQISNMLGIRESYRIDAQYILKTDDIFSYQKFNDGIAVTNYPLDAHGEKDYGAGLQEYVEAPKDEQYFEVPFRCLVPKGIDNVLCAGRCIGADFFSQSSIRIQHTCRYMGEAAGIGAKFAIENGKKNYEIDGKAVRKLMADYGAEMLKK